MTQLTSLWFVYSMSVRLKDLLLNACSHENHMHTTLHESELSFMSYASAHWKIMNILYIKTVVCFLNILYTWGNKKCTQNLDLIEHPLYVPVVFCNFSTTSCLIHNHFYNSDRGTFCSAQISSEDETCVSMEATAYTAEILVSNLLLSTAGRRSLKVTASHKYIFSICHWDVNIFHLYYFVRPGCLLL